MHLIYVYFALTRLCSLTLALLGQDVNLFPLHLVRPQSPDFQNQAPITTVKF